MSLADQFNADTAAAGGQPVPAMSMSDQFAADVAAANKSATNAAIPAVMRAPKTQADPSAWDQLTRQIGLTARAGVTGVTGPPTMIGDALNTGLNYGIRAINSAHDAVVSPTISELVTGRKPWIPELQMPSQAVQQGMNAVGLPQPQDATERVVQDVASSMAGVSPGVGVGRALARATVPAAMGIGSAPAPIVNAVGRGLASLPGMQVFGAAGSAAGSGIARENGAGPAGQIGSGLLGGVAGAVLPSAAIGTARAIRSIPDNVRGVVQPFTNPSAYVGNQLANRLGPDAQTVAENIRNAPEFVPGSAPTTAQAGSNPTLVATEKALANTSPDFKVGLANREAANNQARWDALMGVAQDDGALQAARDARSAASAPLYNEAHQATANVGPAFMRYAQIPEMQQAMQRAHSNAALDAAVGRGVAPVWPTPNSNSINGAALDYTSRALGDMIGEATRSGANSRAASLAALKNSVDNWTERYIPGVQQAKSAYAQGSVPVNTMEVGQQIANTLGTRAMGPTGIPQIQLMPYRSALTTAMRGAEHGIDEGAHNTLQGIGQDLQRSTISNSLRSPGSDTAYNIAANGWLANQLYGPNFQGAGNIARGVGALGALATGHPMVAGGVLMGGRSLGNMAANRLNTSLGELMLDPQRLLPYLEAARPTANGALPALPLGSYINQGLLGSSVTQRPRP